VGENRYKAVVIDLFDTLVNWNPEGLPLVEWRGREIRSTMPLLFPALETALGDRFDRDRFMDAHASVYNEIFTERARGDALEITCLERFVRTLKLLGLDDDETAPLAEILRKTHMGRVREVTRAPAERIEAMKKIAKHLRVGLISNFDDSETGHLIMADTGIRELFDAIIISADTGYRKPNPLIFKKILEMMRLEPAEILFVGDTPHDDVLGAKGIGMHSAWIRTRDRELPEGIPAPDLVIGDLAELPGRIGLRE
jgi:HAD superfamily hydrolase (TIGR01549 family)